MATLSEAISGLTESVHLTYDFKSIWQMAHLGTALAYVIAEGQETVSL